MIEDINEEFLALWMRISKKNVKLKQEEIEEFFLYKSEVKATISIIVVVLNIRVSRWIFGQKKEKTETQ